MVFRRVRGQIVLAQRPDVRETKPSPAQQAQRERFTQAAEYARRVPADPWQRRMYERLAASFNRRVHKLLMSDFLTPPVVEEVDVSGYQRRAGDIVRVIATDDVAVTGVEIAITTTAGVRIEHGPATAVHGVWCYRAIESPPGGEPLVITAVVRDRPGNEARQSRPV